MTLGILPAQTSEDSKRLAIFKETADAAKSIGDKTGDPTAKALYANIISNLRPLRLDPARVVAEIKPGSNQFPVGVLVLLRTDYLKKDLIPMFKYHLKPGAIISGSFVVSKGVIILVERRESSFMKGMVLLHEAKHAANFLAKNQSFPTTEIEDPWDESNVHTFDSHLWRLIGGKPYENLLAREVTRLRAEFKKGGFPGFKELLAKKKTSGFALTEWHYPELGTIITPALSENEKKSRQTALSINAVFQMIDEDLGKGSQADMMKAGIMNYLNKVYGIYK